MLNIILIVIDKYIKYIKYFFYYKNNSVLYVF